MRIKVCLAVGLALDADAGERNHLDGGGLICRAIWQYILLCQITGAVLLGEGICRLLAKWTTENIGSLH